MRNFLISATIMLLLGSCGQPKAYRMNGQLAGAKDGTVVRLLNDNIVVDSTIVVNEKFVFKGNIPLEFPQYWTMTVDQTPEITDRYKKKLKRYSFFADNAVMNFECPVDSMPNYYWSSVQPKYKPVLTGSPAQDLYMKYKANCEELNAISDQLHQKYLEVYHRPALEGVFNAEEGMKVVRERNKVQKEKNKQMIQFIQANQNSVVAVYVASILLNSNRTELTESEINAIVNGFDASLQNSPMMAKLKETAEACLMIAKGKKYADIELTDVKGKKVKLSEFVKLGQYNMLEFWASWCGPCRGEIPHLKHVYQACGKEKFNMISISIDDKDENWKKALKEENMNWTQLCDRAGFYGEAGKKYGLRGVPFCLILDPEGNILIGDVRGAELDVVLEDIFGEQIVL